MINKIIYFSIKHKFLVILLLVIIIGGGLYSLKTINVDSTPDITNNQVQVITVSENLSTTDIEQFVTYPVELAMSNLPGVIDIRSISRFGVSVVTIVFKDNMVHKEVSRGRQTTRHFSLQNKDNRCKIKVLQRFFVFYPYPFDCQTIPFDSHHSVIFCYRNCYTKADSQKNVAVNGK